MEHDKYEHIDKFLEEAEAFVVPEEFISAACVIYTNGDEYLVSFEEAAEIFDAGPLSEQGIQSIRAIIDMEVVKQEVIDLSNEIMQFAYL